MPISKQEIKEYEINNILSSTKEDLEKLTDIELTTISDIIRCRKLNKDVRLYIIQSLLDSVHFLMMQEENRLKKEEKDKNKDQRSIENQERWALDRLIEKITNKIFEEPSDYKSEYFTLISYLKKRLPGIIRNADDAIETLEKFSINSI